MSVFDEIKKYHEEQRNEAKQIIATNDVLSAIKSEIKEPVDFNGYQTHENYQVYKKVADTVNDFFASRVNELSSNTAERASNAHHLAAIHYYCMMDLLGAKPGETSGYASKTFSLSRIMFSDKIKPYRNSTVNFQEQQEFERRFIEHTFSSLRDSMLYHPISFYDINDKYQSIDTALNGKVAVFNNHIEEFPDDMPSYLLSVAKNVSMRFKDMDRRYCEASAVADTLNFAFGNGDISTHDIVRLINEDKLKPLSLWQTAVFHKYMAPKVTAVDVLPYNYKEERNPVFSEINNKLTDQELISTLINTGRLSNIEEWESAMNRFYQIRGIKLTFQQALDLKPSSEFHMLKTNAYYSHIDSTFDPSSFNVEPQVTFRKEKDEDYNFVIEIKSDAFKSPEIDKMVDDHLFNNFTYDVENWHISHNTLTMTGNIHYVSDKKIKNVADQVTQFLKECIEKTPLPGDSVKVIEHDDLSEHPLVKANQTYLVTQMEYGYNGQSSYKLKGVNDTVSSELIEIHMKKPTKRLKPDIEQTLYIG